MKFLEIPSFATISSQLCRNVGDLQIDGRIEAYSCKRAGSDKKLYNDLESHYSSLAQSPDGHLAYSTSPFGPLSQRTSRHTLISLISTLNASFPDYDFRDVTADEFRKELNVYVVANSVNNTLKSVFPDYANLEATLWTELDQEIHLKECSIYSYVPDAESDHPFSEDGLVWSFNYFFYNRKLKRVVFFSCRAINPTVQTIAMDFDIPKDPVDVLAVADNDDYFMF